MPRFNLNQTAFTSGELSPRMYARTDVARYNQGAKELENVIVLIHGGVLRRPGTLYVAATKDHAQASRLIPYVFNIEQSYQLEFGNGYVRFYTDAGVQIESSPGVPYEIASPYTSAQLAEIDFTQGADTLFLFHPEVPPQRLQRFGNTDWRLQNSPFDPEPFDELGDTPAASITLSSAAVGTGRTVTASVASFDFADVGRQITAGGGLLTITAFVSGTQVTGTISSAFSGTSFASQAWRLEGSPQTSCTPSATGPVGATITLTLAAQGFRATDVGKHVNINGGLVRITSFGGSLTVDGVVVQELAATTGAQANAWFLARSMWGGAFGWPRTGSLHQQRLWAAGSPGFPSSLWMSRLGEPYSFEIGFEADSGYEARIASDQANPIRHVASARALLALTLGAEFSIQGSDGGAITPTTLNIQNQSAYGCGVPAPVRVGQELLFVSPAIDEETGSRRDEVRAMAADRFDATSYAAPDVLALAEHMGEGGILDMDAQRSLVWMVRADGQLVTLRLDRDNDVVAASRQITDGVFESVSVIPQADGSRDVWAIVRRTINGQTRRYVERFVPGVYSDAAILGTSGPGATVWTGLSHLEGKQVVVRADGIAQAPLTVTGGQITLSRAANAVEIGLAFTPRVVTLIPEVQGPGGSVQGMQTRNFEVSVRLKDTIGCRVNGRDLQFRNFGVGTLDQPVPPFTGLERVELLGFQRGETELVIEQPQPYPFHLLAVIRRMEFNDG